MLHIFQGVDKARIVINGKCAYVAYAENAVAHIAAVRANPYIILVFQYSKYIKSRHIVRVKRGYSVSPRMRNKIEWQRFYTPTEVVSNGLYAVHFGLNAP